jgi:hypothetical protein
MRRKRNAKEMNFWFELEIKTIASGQVLVLSLQEQQNVTFG